MATARGSRRASARSTRRASALSTRRASALSIQGEGPHSLARGRALGRWRRGPLAASALAASLACATMMAASGASATPGSPPVTTATQGSLTTSLADLAASNEKLTEQFNAAQIALDAAHHRADKAESAAASMRARLSVAQHALAASLAQQYMGSGFSGTGALLSSDSGQAYLERMQTLSQLAQHQTNVADAAAIANTRATAAVAEAEHAVAAAQRSSDEVAAQRASLQKRITQYQSMLATLTASERTAFFGSNNATQSEIDLALASYTIGATPADIVAVRTALSELGKPYVWAASGPSSFDCSGLTMTAWGAAGVSLPHLASSQQSMGTPVDRSQLRPGDLVFFGSPAYHVAIYMGSGMIIQAPQTGDVVKITPLAAMSDYSGAGRFG